MVVGIGGSNGFIGKELKKKLKVSDFTVVPFDFDLKDHVRLANSPKVDLFILLAAFSTSEKSTTKTHQIIDVNLSIINNVLEYCRLNNTHLLFTSTFLYNLHDCFPRDENSELSIENPYQFSKYISEELCRFYSKTFKVKVRILRLSNVYGRNFNGSNFIDFLLFNKSKTLEIFNPRDKRDFIHVSDVCDAIIKSFSDLQRDKDYDVFNIGNGISYSKQEIIDILEINSRCNIKNEEKLISDTVYNIEKAKKFLGWNPRIVLTDYLKSKKYK